MRNYIPAALGVAIGLVFASAAMAYTGTPPQPGAGINGTVHDLGTAHNGMGYTANPPDTGPFASTSGNLNRICIFCHAPHNTYRLAGTGVGSGPQAPDAFDYLPLWNHQLTDNYAVYTMYQNGPGAPTTGHNASQAIPLLTSPNGPSLLCLSCHDGSVAVNAYGNTSQPIGSRSSGGLTLGSTQYVIGKDNYLGNHHPISFSYNAVQSGDIEIRTAGSAIMGAAGTVADHLYGPSATMECGTCHSVHNKGNTGESLLWRSDQASRLCLTCHDKGTDPGAAIP